jgi:hypothetical protein
MPVNIGLQTNVYAPLFAKAGKYQKNLRKKPGLWFNKPEKLSTYYLEIIKTFWLVLFYYHSVGSTLYGIS